MRPGVGRRFVMVGGVRHLVSEDLSDVTGLLRQVRNPLGTATASTRSERESNGNGRAMLIG